MIAPSNPAKFLVLTLTAALISGAATATTLQNIEEIQPVGDQPIDITGEIDLNNNALSNLSAFENCGTYQYLNGDAVCTDDRYSPDSTVPDDQQLSISGHTISLENGGSVTVPDNTIPDDQNIQASASGDTIEITIDNGNGASATIADDTIPDDQQLSISGDTISLDNGGSVTIQDDTIPDDQQLSISGDTISLQNGGSVTIQDDYEANTNAATDCSGQYTFLAGDSGCEDFTTNTASYINGDLIASNSLDSSELADSITIPNQLVVPVR
jgi:hypothetical protein